MKKPVSRFLRDVSIRTGVVFRDAETTIRRIIQWLADKGKLSKEDAGLLIKELEETSVANRREFDREMDAFIADEARRVRLPSRERLKKLRRRVNDLIERVEKLEEDYDKKPAEDRS